MEWNWFCLGVFEVMITVGRVEARDEAHTLPSTGYVLPYSQIPPSVNRSAAEKPVGQEGSCLGC